MKQAGAGEQQIKNLLDKQESETAKIEAVQQNNPNAKVAANMYAFDNDIIWI